VNSISVQISDGVAFLTIQRPTVCNAIDVGVIREFAHAFDRIQKRNSGAQAVVITGADDVFCSGLDLNSVDVLSQPARQRAHSELRRYMDPLIHRMSQFRFPIIAAVKGVAAGAGMSLALASDIIIVGEYASFLPSFARLGFVPDAGITYHLPRRIGGGRSLAALLLAERIDATMAFNWGLAYAMVPSSEVDLRARSVAQRLAKGPSSVLWQIRALHASTYNVSLKNQVRAERLAQTTATEAKDFMEGVTAFFEKREPNFSDVESQKW
jgi:2-(1,2-epoxy-1,2-dihydrophenyl)acetyl-CoA isomerase